MTPEQKSSFQTRPRQISFHDEEVSNDDDDAAIPLVVSPTDQGHGKDAQNCDDGFVMMSRPRSHSVLSSASGDARVSTPTAMRRLPSSREGTPVSSRDASILLEERRSTPTASRRSPRHTRRYESPLQQQQQLFLAEQSMPLNYHRAGREDFYPNPAASNNRAARRRRQREEQFRAAAQRAAANSQQQTDSQHLVDVGLAQSVSRIQIGAGSNVGANSTFQRRLILERVPAEAERPQPALSSKQGPSRRKIRRWENDRMIGIAADLARLNKNAERGHMIAQEFSRGQAEAIHFVQPNHPLNYRSVFASMTDPDRSLAFEDVRQRYLACEKIQPKQGNARSTKAGRKAR